MTQTINLEQLYKRWQRFIWIRKRSIKFFILSYYDYIPNPYRYRLTQYGLLMRIDRPIGLLLLLWPTLWALWIAAEGWPEPSILLIFILGVFLMRSAGCVINDYADRDIDSHVKRTQNRPLAQRRIPASEALYLFAFLGLLAFGLVSFLNTFTIWLSCGAITIATLYPLAKRYVYFPQVILGAAFAWAIPMAFSAVTNSLPPETWLLFVSTLLWVLAYDTLYGMVDRYYDIKIGVKSTAILFGDTDIWFIGIVQACFLLGMTLLGIRNDFKSVYYICIALCAILVMYQLWVAKRRKPKECFQAFLNNNYIGLLLFVGIYLNYQ